MLRDEVYAKTEQENLRIISIVKLGIERSGKTKILYTNDELKHGEALNFNYPLWALHRATA